MILCMLMVCNMCKQYLSCAVICWHSFRAMEDVNVKLNMSSVCQNQNVGDANLCQTQNS